MEQVASRLEARRSAFVHYFWGALDLVYLSWYIVESLKRDKVPFLSDLLLINDAYKHSGILIGIVYSYLGWLLSLSVCLSAILLLLRRNSAKFFCYVQSPVRVVYLAPSLSLIYFLPESLRGDPWVIGLVLIFSELSKIFSLWRWT